MPKRSPLVSRHRQSITPATRFRQLPVWVSRADIVAYFKVGKVDAQTLIDSVSRRWRIDGVQKISKYALQVALLPDLIAVMQQHPSRRSTRRLFTSNTERLKKSSQNISWAVRDEQG